MQAENLQLKVEVEQLRVNSPYEKSFAGSFAYLNTVMAFGQLRGVVGPIDPHGKCHVKISTAQDNAQAAWTLTSIAKSFGCYVFEPSGNPDLNPDVRTEASNSTPNLVVIHAQKGNAKADSFVVGKSNTSHVQRTYLLPKDAPVNLVWIEVGSGSIWRVGP
jgi:hypothetical protein